MRRGGEVRICHPWGDGDDVAVGFVHVAFYTPQEADDLYQIQNHVGDYSMFSSFISRDPLA